MLDFDKNTEEFLKKKSGSSALGVKGMVRAIDAFDSNQDHDQADSEILEPTEQFTKHKHKSKKSVKSKRAFRRGMRNFGVVILIVLLAIALMIAIGAYNMKYKNDFKLRYGRGAISYDEGKTVFWKGKKYLYNENCISVAFIGTDLDLYAEYVGRNGQSDFLSVIVLDTATGKTRAIVIPRDTMIEIGEYVGEQFAGMNQLQQICMAYGYGDNGYWSCKYTLNTMERLFFNMPMKYYVSVNYRDIPTINDSIGGVSMTPIESIPGTYITAGVPTTLSGSAAKSYIQWRDMSRFGSDKERMERQKHYASSYVSQLFNKKGVIGTVVQLYNDSLTYVTTNLGVTEVMYLTSVALRKNLSNPDIVSLEGTRSMGEDYEEFWVDEEKLWELVLDTYYTKVSDSDYENMSYNDIELDDE